MSDYTREQVIEMLKNSESLLGADLSGIDLSEADLRRADLSETNLSGAYLSKANLSKANLSEANLSFANFFEANLTGTNLNQANLIGATLFGVNLSMTDLIEVNLSKANLSVANLALVNLCNSNLRGANLASVDFEFAFLENADISGTNIYHLKTHGWIIDGIKCTHVYQCPANSIWENQKEREKYRRDYKPGEFEALYRTLPKIELIFQQGFTPQDLSLLTAMIEQINQRLPSPLDMSELKKGMSTNISLTAENNKILKTAIPMIHEMYQKLESKNGQIQQLFYDKAKLEDQVFELVQDKHALIRKQHEPQKTIHKPDIYIENAQFDGTTYVSSPHYDNRQYFFSSPEKADEIAQQIINELCSSDNIPETLAQIDREISPQLKESPEKKEWLKKALLKFKDQLDEISDKLTPVVQTASGYYLIEILKLIFKV